MIPNSFILSLPAYAPHKRGWQLATATQGDQDASQLVWLFSAKTLKVLVSNSQTTRSVERRFFMGTQVETSKINLTVRTGTWIDEYADWASKRSPLTPYHFHQNIALTLIAGAIARRSYVQLPHEKVYPNLYTLIIAKTSVYAKTTAFKIASEVSHAIMPDRLLTSISTPEAMINELAGVQPVNLNALSQDKQDLWRERKEWGARRLFVLDEAGRFFNSLARDYNSGLDAIMMELYDSSDKPIERNTTKSGMTIVDTPCLSCLFATTPGNIKRALNESGTWESGFWIRWNFVTATQPEAWKESVYIGAPREVLQPLENMSLALAKRCKSASIGKGVNRAFNMYSEGVRDMIMREEEEKLHGVLSRLPTKRMKAALCLATLENPKAPQITIDHWNITSYFATGWERDAILTLQASAKSEKASLEDRVMTFIIDNQLSGVTARDIQQRTAKSAEVVLSILTIFYKSKMIEPSQRGRATVWKPSKEI